MTRTTAARQLPYPYLLHNPAATGRRGNAFEAFGRAKDAAAAEGLMQVGRWGEGPGARAGGAWQGPHA
jgi:hypothetical protein